jgi:hypothetical protein
MAEILALTDALLAAARSPNPDLDHVASLLSRREKALESLPPADPSEREDRLRTLQQIQLVDAEIRAYFVERQAQVRDELGVLMMRPRHKARRQSRTGLVDQVV